jgi:hypothetical protein
MTDASPRFALPFILPGQAQKEVFHNEALTAIDCALHPCIEGADAIDPPGDPEAGDSWIVGEGATGAWAERSDFLATWTAGGWRFTAPVAGMMIWNKASACWTHWGGDQWSDGVLPATAIVVGGNQVVGSRRPDIPTPYEGTTIDTEARAAIVAVIATLKSHGLIE